MPQPLVESFGQLSDGRGASVVTLESASLRARVTDYGARLVSLEMPDRDGRWAHVLLGFDDVGAYERAGGSFGAVLGRAANRIAKARFTLDGRTHYLVSNDGPSTLHGGTFGFGKLPWTVVEVADGLVRLALESPDGDEGFPGTMRAEACYRLAGDTLSLELQARTDRATVVNLSCHPYFNLADVATSDVLGHELTVEADAFLPVDSEQIPLGDLAQVAGTPFDFRAPHPLGARIRQAHPQLLPGRGYDVCFALRDGRDVAAPVARLRDPVSGRCVEVATTQPGLQVYSGNSLDGSVVGRGGVVYRQSAGVALEAQNYPDAPNHPTFPSAALHLGELYRETISFRFYLTD